MPDSPSPQQPNSVGNASMWLGIASAALVFGIGMCALTGLNQRWIQLAGTPLFVCGVSSAFLGLLAVVLGIAGMFGRDKSRSTAIVGLILGLLGACMFPGFLRAIGGG
ncbi:MAG: hypothetical protein HND47_19420 [Chloroflexi bacterium]|nr:hypothetical protein [Chloroflexota bacterium]